MAKDDFDMDFHFDDDDFDPKAFLDGEDGADIDLSEFDDVPSGGDKLDETVADGYDDELDLSGLGLDEDSDETVDELDLDDILSPKAVRRNSQEHDDFGTNKQENDSDFDGAEFLDDEDDQTQAAPEDDSDFQSAPEDDTDFHDEPEDEDDYPDEEVEDKPARRRKEKPEKASKPPRERKPKEPKEAKPNVFTKLYDLYFAPLTNKEALEAPVDPAIKKNEIEASISSAKAAEEEYQRIMDEAAELAANYDYEGAIEKLDSFPDIANYPDMSTKRAEYVNAMNSLVEYKDYSQIPNLSFHVLIADPARAFNDKELGGKYNQNFVTIDEFSKILEQLYANNYVLVDFDDFVNVGQTVSGTDQFEAKSIFLPPGKKPLMLTETMVNYFEYMVDSNKDGVADAGGAGFANKLVLDENGDIKAQYIDSSNNTLTGNYDFVPILEDFIKAHPDFSYRGARAILAVTGSQGIFGYRCNTSYVSTKGNDFYEQEKAGAIAIVEALKAKGYRLACYTYDNKNYRDLNSAGITADLQSWTQQIKPIIGNLDTFVFAQASNLSDYTGTSFNVMYTADFRYFISNGKEPKTEVNNTYVRQDRLMVTGETMVWYKERFTDRGLFDPNMVVDMTARGNNVPKAG